MEPMGASDVWSGFCRLVEEFDSIFISRVDLGAGAIHVISGVKIDGGRVRASGITPVMAALAALGEEVARECKACRKVLPAGLFHRNAKRPEGLSPRCRKCERSRIMDYKRRRRAGGGQPLRGPAPEDGAPRACYWCGTMLPASAYYADRRRRGGRRGSCKECEKSRWPT